MLTYFHIYVKPYDIINANRGDYVVNKTVTIEFVNKDYLKYGEQYGVLFNQKHYFKYNNQTQMRDLFNMLMSKVSVDKFYHNDDYLQHSFWVNVDNRNMMVQLDYGIHQFLTVRGIDNLKLYYNFSGRGAAAFISLGSIRINPDESEHKEIPHIHVYKNNIINWGNCVRFFVKDKLTIFVEDKKKFTKLFTNKQRKQLMEFLEEYREKFENYYESIQKGEAPHQIEMYYDGKKIIFK